MNSISFTSKPAAGVPTTAVASFSNVGTAPSGTFAVKWYLDGVQVAYRSYASLAPGASSTSNFNWTPTGSDPKVIRRSAWEMVTGGGALNYSDEINYSADSNDHWSRRVTRVFEEPRGGSYNYLDILYEFFISISFHRMAPHTELLSEASQTGINCLAWPDHEYVVSFRRGGTINLNLSSANGVQFVAKWVDPRSGVRTDANGGQVDGGGRVSFTAPGGDDWALLLQVVVAPDGQ